MTKLVAQQEVYYAGKTRRAGDTFNASEQEAKILVGIGKARREDLPPQPQPAAMQTQALKAQEVPAKKPMATDNEALATPKKRGNYKRRDMRAER